MAAGGRGVPRARARGGRIRRARSQQRAGPPPRTLAEPLLDGRERVGVELEDVVDLALEVAQIVQVGLHEVGVEPGQRPHGARAAGGGHRCLPGRLRRRQVPREHRQAPAGARLPRLHRAAALPGVGRRHVASVGCRCSGALDRGGGSGSWQARPVAPLGACAGGAGFTSRATSARCLPPALPAPCRAPSRLDRSAARAPQCAKGLRDVRGARRAASVFNPRCRNPSRRELARAAQQAHRSSV
jgi:hypothetical protein